MWENGRGEQHGLYLAGYESAGVCSQLTKNSASGMACSSASPTAITAARGPSTVGGTVGAQAAGSLFPETVYMLEPLLQICRAGAGRR